jgi:hypothetical protein
MIDWSEMLSVRKPTKEEKSLYNRWRLYFKTLGPEYDEEKIHKYCCWNAEVGKEPPNGR